MLYLKKVSHGKISYLNYTIQKEQLGEGRQSMGNKDFYTLRGYDLMNQSSISIAMEDYLEMIYRLLQEKEYVRVNQLATLLNVTPSSSSKMVAKLKKAGFVHFESYGIIQLTEAGRELGKYLLYRHEVLESFFCMINNTESELELVEKIEHFIDKRTVENLRKLVMD